MKLYGRVNEAGQVVEFRTFDDGADMSLDWYEVVADAPVPSFNPLVERLAASVTFDTGFIHPTWSVEPLPRSERVFTPLDLVGPGGLLTDAERAAIVWAAQTDVSVALWQVALLSAAQIHAADPRTVQGFEFAVSKGLLSAGRVADLLGA